MTYYDSPWIYRAKIVSSILNAAHMFTFKSKDFGFYLTDISIDNIAINSEGTAKFIDLENIIVVDKNISEEGSIYEFSILRIIIFHLNNSHRRWLHYIAYVLDKSATWHNVQENTIDLNCSNCFPFSPTDICNHRLSDHNYYAICRVCL